MDDNGIAWMIAGGVRAESLEDQRQRRQRVELARIKPVSASALLQLRQRLAAIVGGPATQPALSADCCTA